MALQASDNFFRGSINNLTYYFRNNKALVRRKSKLDKTAYYSNKKNLLSKRNNQEMATASSFGKLFRAHIRQLLFQTTDAYSAQRFTGLLTRILRTDTLSSWGNRQVQNGNISLAKGFNFNNIVTLENLFFAPYSVSFNMELGEVIFDVPEIQKATNIKAPVYASHFKIISACILVDYPHSSNDTTIIESGFIPFNNEIFTIKHTHSIPPGTTNPIFLVSAIRFYQNINDELYLIRNKECTPTAIIGTHQG